MRISVEHRTRYQYSAPVTTSHHEARLSPRDSEHQRTLSQGVEISPEPSVVRRRSDYFGNRTLYFGLCEPHLALEVTSKSVVELMPRRLEDPSRAPPWEQVALLLKTDRKRDVLDAYELTFNSMLVKAHPTLAQYARPSFTSARPVLEAARDLTRRIHSDFTYDRRATDIATPLEKVLEQRRGVCQDFAHLMIGCLRSHGLAGRYVSGYLVTEPPPGQPRLRGADASHAWAATWVPEFGWIDFDPTNDLIPNGQHVTLAYGRDFDDVTPLRGVILGGGHHTLKVAVDVVPVDDEI
jgi:transglutaminase-like putative cysteine protease